MSKCKYCGEEHHANYQCPAKLNALSEERTKPEFAAHIIEEYQMGLLTAYEAIAIIRNNITTKEEVTVSVPETSTVYRIEVKE